MTERGIKKWLIERVRKIYKETKDRVRVGNEVSEEYWTELKLRQGCPMSSLLFAVFIADMEEVLKRGLEGGIAVGGSRFWKLAYADGIIVIAREEEVLRSMIKRLEKYLEERKLTLNAKKSKVMVFDKQRRKREEREWVWKGDKIEEVKEFIYLGFLLRKNEDIKGHVRERVKRATIIMKKVWGIREKIFKDDFKRRMRLYDTLVASVLLYGVEIWGWKEYEEIERLYERYIH